MSRGHALACLLAGSMLAGPALAQTSLQQPPAGAAAPTAPMAQPDRTDTMTGQSPAPMAAQPGQGQPMSQNQGAGAMGTQPAQVPMTQAQQAAEVLQPMAAPQPGQMLGSNLRGTRVYGANNENIGDISDILLDRDGRVVAVIVGVGGFLGIGQKDVAVPYDALEIVANERTAAAGRTGTTGAAGGTGMAGAAGTPGAVGTDPATTGAVGTQGTAGTTATGGAAGVQQGTMNPDRIVLRRMTKADLENAPSFRADGRVTDAQRGAAGRSDGAGTTAAPATPGSAPAGGATAPRQ